jgi:glycosyltransferase involved in cell wall biosynthesis
MTTNRTSSRIQTASQWVTSEAVTRTPLRLLQVIPTAGRGGCEEYALTIAAGCISEGWRVDVALPYFAETQSLHEDFARTGARVHSLNIRPSARFPPHSKWVLMSQFLHAFQLMGRVRPEVMHVSLPFPYFGLGVMLASAAWRIPTQVVFQLVPHDRQKLGKRVSALYSWARLRNQQWIAVSKQNRSLLCSIFHVPESTIEVIYNGATPPTSTLNTIDCRRQILAELGWDAGTTLLLSVGRLEHQKGFDILVRALPHLIREFSSIRMVIAGEGGLRMQLEELTRQYKMEQHIRFLGHRKDVSRLMIASDLFVFPTRYEGHPFSLVEALAHGKPVLSSDASGIPEIIESKTQGLLFRCDDACDFLEQARYALRNRSFWADWGTAGKKVASQFSREEMVSQTLSSMRRLQILSSC